jgi:hypothetical protein
MPESLVALRDRREQVISRLSDGYARDLIDVDELERRLDLAHGAHSVAELEALVADLADPEPRTASTALVVAGPTAIDDPQRAETRQLRVIMSAIERRGRWTVPRSLDVRVLWGDTQLDFRDASLGPGITTIHVRVFMGNIDVVLPPSLAIEVDVSSFAGAVTERHRVPPDDDPGRPQLRIVGTVRFGNLDITTRLPGESARDAERRERRARKQLRRAERDADRLERHERKQLRRGSRRALPPGSGS